MIERDKYTKLGLEKCKQDRKIDRESVRNIERRINDQSRFWTRILNSGLNHDHMDRIMKSKLCSSENPAPKYFMYKDHKVEGGYRPVVGGCNSDTLGLSNTLSEVVEAVAMGVNNPYEVVSSEDMLSRIYNCNEEIKKLKEEKGANWNWKEELILIGTDVQSLFPSLSAEKTGEAVRIQFAKSNITWENIDWKLLALYVKLHDYYWKGDELDPILSYLPTRKSNMGRPPSIGTINLEQKYSWPQIIEYIGTDAKRLLMGLAIEIGVVFFFNNFTYTFANQVFLQMFGGPIGARLTMAVARLVMQTWFEEYEKILDRSKIDQLLSA